MRKKQTTFTSGLPSATNGLPSATNGLPSATNGLPSATNGLPSATNGLPSAQHMGPSASGAMPSVDVSQLTDKFSGINLGISTTLKVHKLRCCTNCKQSGHYKNKCPLPNTKVQPTVSVVKPSVSTTVQAQTPAAVASVTQLKSISSRPPPTPRTEVQGHGKTWENDILINVYGADEEIIKTSGYTQTYDLKAKDNKLDGCNLSVKTTGSGTIYMGDCSRIYNSVSSGQPYHLVVINYAQRGQYKHVTRIIEFDITGLKTELFGQLTGEQITQLADAVKAIPQKHKPTADERKVLYDLKATLQPLSGIIGLDIKCNSQQSRLQCSISAGRFKDLLAKFPERIIATSNTNAFRGGVIRESIPSEKRTFKKKTGDAVAEPGITGATETVSAAPPDSAIA